MAGVDIAPLTPISLGGSAGRQSYWDEQVDVSGKPLPIVDAAGATLKWGEGPTYLSEPWDTIYFNQVQLPGLCEVDGGVELKIDKKKAPGSDGIVLTSTGLLPGPVDITLTLWTKNQWEEFQKKKPLIWVSPDRGWPVQAVEVQHPAFNLWDINLIVITKVSVPKKGRIPQSVAITMRCQHWRPNANKNRTHTVKAPTVVEDQRTTSAGLDDPSKTDTGPKD